MSIQLAGSNPQKIQDALNLFGVTKFTELPDWAQRQAFPATSPDQGGLKEDFSELRQFRKEAMDPATIQELLRIQRESQAEQMKEAGKYKLLFDLPERLTQAATLPGQLAAEGTRGIASSMMQAGQMIPNLVGYERGA